MSVCFYRFVRQNEAPSPPKNFTNVNVVNVNVNTAYQHENHVPTVCLLCSDFCVNQVRLTFS